MSKLGKKIDVAELQRLIAFIDVLVAGAQAELGPRPDWSAGIDVSMEYSGRKRKAGEQVIRTLIHKEGARVRRQAPYGRWLKLAGVQTSCTGGDWGLLRNWQNAARRYIPVLS